MTSIIESPLSERSPFPVTRYSATPDSAPARMGLHSQTLSHPKAVAHSASIPDFELPKSRATAIMLRTSTKTIDEYPYECTVCHKFFMDANTGLQHFRKNHKSHLASNSSKNESPKSKVLISAMTGGALRRNAPGPVTACWKAPVKVDAVNGDLVVVEPNQLDKASYVYDPQNTDTLNGYSAHAKEQSVSEHQKSDGNADPSSFLALMIVLAEEHNVDLSPADLDLLASLPGTESFKYSDCKSQLESHGLCVEVPRFTNLPFSKHSEPKDIERFRYGPKQRMVYFYPRKLTALGLSVLSWILPPGPRCSRYLQNVMNLVPFPNCFTSEITGRMPQGEPQKVVVPLGWAYELRVYVDIDFLLEHGKWGDMAVRLGTIGSRIGTRRRDAIPPTAKMDHHCLRRDCKICVTPVGANRRTFRGLTRIRGGYEHLYLNEFQLVYMRAPGRPFEFKEVSGSIGIPCLPVGGNVALERATALQRLLDGQADSHKVPIISLSHYIGLAMCGSPNRDVMERMHWLYDALFEKSVYPGRADPTHPTRQFLPAPNQEFLKVTTGDAHLNTLKSVFHIDDCRIEVNDLRKTHKAMLDASSSDLSTSGSSGPVRIYFQHFELAGTQKVRSLKAHLHGDMLLVEGPFETVDLPPHTIPLSYPLG